MNRTSQRSWQVTGKRENSASGKRAFGSSPPSFLLSRGLTRRCDGDPFFLVRHWWKLGSVTKILFIFDKLRAKGKGAHFNFNTNRNLFSLFTFHTFHSCHYFHSFHSTLYSFHSSLQSFHSPLHSFHSPLHSFHYPVHSFILHFTHFTLHFTHHFTLYSIHFTLYSILFTSLFTSVFSFPPHLHPIPLLSISVLLQSPVHHVCAVRSANTANEWIIKCICIFRNTIWWRAEQWRHPKHCAPYLNYLVLYNDEFSSIRQSKEQAFNR